MQTELTPVFVYGASGHAKVVIDAIERAQQYAVQFLIDDDPATKGVRLYGYEVTGGREALIRLRAKVKGGIVAIGDNPSRKGVAEWLQQHGFEFITVVHPSAVIARGVAIGAGTVVMPGAIVNADASIGEHVIINTAATVDHDCRIGAFCHIAPGTHLCGSVTIGARSFLCAGVTVAPNRLIGDDVVIGAGSTVLSDLPARVTAVGTPAKIRGQRQ